MSLLHRRIATMTILALFLASGTLALAPSATTWNSDPPYQVTQQSSVAESAVDVSVPYVDKHYGAADGIIDPAEYAVNFTDEVTGVTAYIEHNGSAVFLGLSAPTSGWIGVAWQNYTDSFTSAGLNNSDILLGYAPGTPHRDYWRAKADDAGSVHYVLTDRNGTLIQDDFFPNDQMNDPFYAMPALQLYQAWILAGGGMRLGEVRHFIIPAAYAYSSDPSHALYGLDLEYEITLTRLMRGGTTRFLNTTDPTDSSRVVLSDRHGTNTLQHLEDSDQSRVLEANATDDGEVTQLEYIIQMTSGDSDDVSLLNGTGLVYPFVFMYSNTEDFRTLPNQRTYWTTPVMIQFEPNAEPTIAVESPAPGASLAWVDTFTVNATDNTFVRSVKYRIDNDNWTDMKYDFLSELWDLRVDVTEYDEGPHTVWFNATDPSGTDSVSSVDITISRPFSPYLGMKVDVQRLYRTQPYHVAQVEDRYTITNNGSSSIGVFQLYLPAEYASNFLSLTATDSDGNEVAVIRLEDKRDMLVWRLHLFKPVGFGETYTFTTYMQVHSLDILVDIYTKGYELTFLKFPVVPYVINEAQFRLILQTGDSLTAGFNLPDTTMENLAPMTEERFTTYIDSFSPYIVAYRTTVVTVNPWGWLSYRETIELRNIGPLDTPEGEVTVILPAYSAGVRISDRVGILTQSQFSLSGEWNTTRSVDIDLQADRFGEQLQPGYSYKFNIDYVVRINEYEHSAEGATLLEPPMGSLEQILVLSHTVDLVLPYTLDTLEASGNYRLLFGVFDTTIRYRAHNVSDHNPIEIQLLYRPSPIVVLRPLGFALIFGLIAMAYVAYRGFQEVSVTEEYEDEEDLRVEKRQVGAPPSLLREFANLYSRKTALGMDLEKLEAARRRGKVKKREFMIRERDIKSQIEQIDSKLPSLQDDLGGYGSRYRDMVSQIELQNEKIEGAKAGLRQLLLRKKKQRISRVAFEKSRQDYLKTIQKATTAIDRILLSIQEEAGEF
ncbi:MAG: hypothetical protein ACFFCK_01335 [Promethearchaeota archaeon]